MTRSITKIFLLTTAGLFFMFSAFAGSTGNSASQQNNWQLSNKLILSAHANAKTTSSVPSSIDAAPGVQMPKGKGQGFNKAPFDIDIQFNLFDSITPGSYTGIAYTGSEFWVSRWNQDTMVNMTPGGAFISKFIVPGVTATRALTWDGTNIYSGSAGQAIFEIDPVTKTLTNTITLSGTVGARMCAYDPNADGGNGGFWIGNFTSNIQLISRTGTVLTTIAQATHGITGIYGGAVDTTTAGGPYLLVYAQDGASQNTIHWIDLNTNTPTGISYDVNADVPVAGIAGGLFVADGLVPGEQHIVTITQEATSGNILTAYERGLPPTPAGEIELLASAVGGVLNNSFVPADQATAGPQALTALASPVSGGPFDSAIVTATLNSGAVNLASPFATVAPGGAVALTTNTFTPMAGTNYTGTVDLSANSDTDPLNNSYAVDMTVSDSVLARENSTVAGGQLSFAATNYIGNVIELVGQDTLTSISCFFSPGGGVTYPITASLAFLDYNAGPGNFAIFQTPAITVNAPGWVTVSTPDIILAPGAYFVGAQEQGAYLPLATDTLISYPGVAVGGPLGGVNIDVRQFGFFHTFMARANFSDVVPSNLTAFTLTAPADGTVLDVMGAGTQTVNITWNASTATPAATVNYEWLLDLQGGNFSNPLAVIPAGSATNLTLTYQDIDNLLASLGVAIGATVNTSWTVRASAPGAQLLATTAFDLDLIRSGLTPTSGSRDFEAYNAGDLIVANDVEWEFWPGATLDAPVSVAQSQSGTNSLLIDGAPNQDLVFKLGDQTSGTWGAGFSLYIPSGNGAYYNLQETEVPGIRWPIGNVVFDPAGTGTIDGVTPQANFTFPHDTWFDVRNYVDLDNDTFQVWINNTLVASGVWTAAPPQGGGTAQLQLGGINIYPDGAGGSTPAQKVFYLDDMYFQPDSLRTPVTYSFSPFNLTSPPDQTRLVVEDANATPVVIDWDATTVTPSATPEYRWLLDVQGGTFTNPLLDIDADNGGTDSQLTLTSGAIATELANLGIACDDSVDVIWTVEASVAGQGAFAANGPYDIRLVRTCPIGFDAAAIANNISFFPNPTTGQLVVKVRDNVVNNVMIQSMIGQNLKSFEINSTTSVLDLSDLGSGMYIIRFVSENQEYSQKLIIE